MRLDAEAGNLEFRVETFNLLNNFTWGDPVSNCDHATFGKIQSIAGSPRLMQFAVKFAF